MALSNYTELQTSIAAWANRDDLTDKIPDFIALAESDMSVTLRTRRNTTVGTVSFATTGLAAQPSDYRAIRAARLSASPNYRLRTVTLDKLTELVSTQTEGDGSPHAVAEQGTNLRCYPAPSASTDAVLVYYAAIPALSTDNVSNWVLTNYPQIYLYGAIAHAHAYMDDTEEERKFRAKFEDAMQRANVEGRDTLGDAAEMILSATTP